MRVLLVDDSAAVLRSLSRMFTSLENIEVIGRARSVSQAIDLVDTIKPDVVILDISFPEGSGFDVLSHIRRDRIPAQVIMLTNHTSAQYRQRSQAEGADFFFDKSMEFERVVEVVKQRAQLSSLAVALNVS